MADDLSHAKLARKRADERALRFLRSITSGSRTSSSKPNLQRSSKSKRRRRAAANQITPLWYTPGSGPPEEEKVFLSSEELRKLIFDQLDPMLDRRSTVYLADANYYCTPIDNAMEIIGLSQVEHRTWIDEVFDCDDFAHMFKGKFLESAYKNGQRRTPHCFGIVWGTIDGGSHAFNWMVNSDMLLRFVEPQDYDVIEIDRKKSDIQLMIA